jgi:tRNA (uracil-5-)-methyltransferase TRM9
MPMNDDTRDLLIDLNRTFYQTFAQDFSATRQRLQPGVLRIIEQISDQDNILDLGCGNCQLGKTLIQNGHRGLYTGLDSSSEFLAIGHQSLYKNPNVTLVHGDLTNNKWMVDLPIQQYDIVLAFAVLHHVPDLQLRKQILLEIASLTQPGARFIHSVWQLLNSPRLKTRIQPWKTVGLTDDEIDEGDILIDWRAGGQGLRYVHIFNMYELEYLADETGFEIIESFHSDGEGGNLGLYQIWKRL